MPKTRLDIWLPGIQNRHTLPGWYINFYGVLGVGFFTARYKRKEVLYGWQSARFEFGVTYSHDFMRYGENPKLLKNHLCDIE